MLTPKVFSFMGEDLRVVIQDDQKFWFVAADVLGMVWSRSRWATSKKYPKSAKFRQNNITKAVAD